MAINKRLIQLSESQNHRCCYCGRHTYFGRHHKRPPGMPKLSMATIEHVVPRSMGGVNHRDNLVMACEACNTKRRDHVDAFTFYTMRQDPDKEVIFFKELRRLDCQDKQKRDHERMLVRNEKTMRLFLVACTFYPEDFMGVMQELEESNR